MSRRANGEGTITRRKDGRYAAAAYVYKPDGTRARKWVYGKTRAEVASKLTEMQEKTRQGIPAITSSMPLDKYLDYWLRTVAPERYKPSTMSSYEPITRVYIVPALGRKPLNRLTPADVRRFLTDFRAGCLCCLRRVDHNRAADKRECCAVGKCCERRPSARTVQYAHAVLRSSLQSAVREELLARNVARLVERPSVPHKEVQPLNAAEVRLLLRAAREHRLYPLWLLLVSTGLRRGEVLALTWSDVDLKARQLRVRRNLQRVGGQLLFGTPKTARSLRTIALPASCVAQLRERQEQQVQERAEAGLDWQPLDIQPDGLVFTTLTGTALDPRNLNRSLAALCSKAKLRPIRVHDLRHTCASLMLAEGVGVRTIMETLGHSSITMTLDTYAHVMQTTLHDAANRMDDALGMADNKPDGGEEDDGPAAAGVPVKG
ncbi:tyrosine-type recombinase/integrase [Kitasatospora sp. DSM 101779]|uniref:tyrosine-type recombinase/integrase n=1 Tax=Kitasatospora sp. DSM 101779 TaxID=2853165 RepID=UPI0021D8C1AF|nr:site-specific integrase [Kitasatospora sp. DSM 101779]MCU7822210.1 site-specific integrase [Kitasatospora sp. DSM 101779]